MGSAAAASVLITHGPGFTGFCASLHAEHPELGITVLRVPESAEASAPRSGSPLQSLERSASS